MEEFIGHLVCMDLQFDVFYRYEPDSERTSGGKVAAPIFARVAERSLRLLGVPPDNMADNGPGLLARRPE